MNHTNAKKIKMEQVNVDKFIIMGKAYGLNRQHVMQIIDVSIDSGMDLEAVNDYCVTQITADGKMMKEKKEKLEKEKKEKKENKEKKEKKEKLENMKKVAALEKNQGKSVE